mmetsp:Transcript_798/g.2090  ORF Transcript_798/g.2090 Transcript_798/m.2090 type:complete len:131 (-) Transcript_798:217-609(-)
MDVKYRAEGKQRFYAFLASDAPPLKWQRAVAHRYPELNFVLSYESVGCEFQGYVSYAQGREVGQFGADACVRRSLALVLGRFDAEQKALKVLRPVLALYVQDRLYRYPDGLRLPAVRSAFESRRTLLVAA